MLKQGRTWFSLENNNREPEEKEVTTEVASAIIVINK